MSSVTGTAIFRCWKGTNRHHGSSAWYKSPSLRLFVYLQSQHRYQELKSRARSDFDTNWAGYYYANPVKRQTPVIRGCWDFGAGEITTGQMPHPLSVNKDQMRVFLHRNTRIKCEGRRGCKELCCLVGIWSPTRASAAGPLGASPPWWSAAW